MNKLKKINPHYINQILSNQKKLNTFSELMNVDSDMASIILTQHALYEILEITRAVIITLELPHDADVWVEA